MIRTVVKRCGNYLTSCWSGGNTTEFFVYPEGASYAAQDFLFRISSATVDTKQSEFTRLPGIRRILMVLEGTVELTCGSGPPVSLSPYECFEFSGEDDTKSKGICRDFNLMMRKGCTGQLEALDFSGDTTYDRKGICIAVYALFGQFRVCWGEGEEQLLEGDSILCLNPSGKQSTVTVEGSVGTVILAMVNVEPIS